MLYGTSSAHRSIGARSCRCPTAFTTLLNNNGTLTANVPARRSAAAHSFWVARKLAVVCARPRPGLWRGLGRTRSAKESLARGLSRSAGSHTGGTGLITAQAELLPAVASAATEASTELGAAAERAAAAAEAAAAAVAALLLEAVPAGLNRASVSSTDAAAAAGPPPPAPGTT